MTVKTNVGDILLTKLPFNVSNDLPGLQSLNSEPTIISNVDIYQGYLTYLQINAGASIFNPSSVGIITNDVIFAMEFNAQVIGSVTFNEFSLPSGRTNLLAEIHYAPTDSDAVAAGIVFLGNYIQGIASNISIIGTSTSSPYGSLQPAFGNISIQTSFPPLLKPLLTAGAHLHTFVSQPHTYPFFLGHTAITFPIDVATLEGAQVSLNISNPFTASINIISIIADLTYQNLSLGQIRAQTLSPEIISVGGHSSVTSSSFL